MAKVFRIFVEKKRGNDIEAGQTLADLRDNVGLNALDDLMSSDSGISSDATLDSTGLMI